MNTRSALDFLHRSLCTQVRIMEQQSVIVRFALLTLVLTAVLSHGAHRYGVRSGDCRMQPCSKSFIESMFRVF
ncbi:MAG: hypothetical protein ACKOAG_11355 [Candidatus Kapaibacterium sp.]